MPDVASSAGHLHAGFRPLGQRQVYAICTCGHEERAPDEAAALRALLDEHGARRPKRGETAEIPYGRD